MGLSSVILETIADAADETAAECVSRIGPDTPPSHAAALIAMAASWASFSTKIRAEDV